MNWFEIAEKRRDDLIDLAYYGPTLDPILFPESRAYCDLPNRRLDDLDPRPVRGGRSIDVKYARPSFEELDMLIKFLTAFEEYHEEGRCQTLNADAADAPIDSVEFVGLASRFWSAASVDCSWRRVVYAARVLLESVCDLDSDQIQFRPDLKQLVDTHNALVEILPYGRDL